MTTLKLLNKKLKETYGTHSDGRPYFRYTFPEKETEKRFGKFNEYYGPIFLRTEVGVKERKKYPWLKHGYLLEKLTFPKQSTWTADLIGLWEGSYEPVWYFDCPKLPNWDVTQYLVNCALFGPEELKKLSQADLDALEYKKFEKEVADTYNFLDNESPDIPHALATGEGVTLSGSKILQTEEA